MRIYFNDDRTKYVINKRVNLDVKKKPTRKTSGTRFHGKHMITFVIYAV